jgi:hypothetical protein
MSKVYSPYTDRELWINPEYERMYGVDDARTFVLQRDKQGAQMCGKIGDMVSDIGMIAEIEQGLTNDKTENE